MDPDREISALLAEVWTMRERLGEFPAGFVCGFAVATMVCTLMFFYVTALMR